MRLRPRSRASERPDLRQCANRDERLRANVHHLLDELATSPGHRARFEASPGLCFGHLGLAWDTAQTLEDRSVIHDVQRNATAGRPAPAESAAESERHQ